MQKGIEKTGSLCVVRPPTIEGKLEVNALGKLCGQSELITPQRQEICGIYTPTAITP